MEISSHVDAAAAIERLRRLMDAPLTTLAPARSAALLQPIEERELHDDTPVDTALLQGSTGSHLEQTKAGTELLLTQDAKVRPNEDGSGGGYDEWPYVVHGHGAVEAPADVFEQGDGPWPSHSTGKPAFGSRLKGFGPVNYIGAVAPNDYPLLAIDSTRVQRQDVTRAEAIRTVLDVLVIGG